MLEWTKLDGDGDEESTNEYWKAGPFLITKANKNTFFLGVEVKKGEYVCLGERKTRKGVKNLARNIVIALIENLGILVV